VTPETRYARNGDVHLAYQVWGEGEVDLVVVPGFVSHLEMLWSHPAPVRFLERLGSFARVIAFDRRGTGLSDPISVTQAPDLDTRMSDIAAVMDEVGSERAVIYGLSEGGPTAALFAATHPARTEALVLYGAMARSTYADDHPWLLTEDDFNASGAEFLLPAWGQGVTIDATAPSRRDDPEVISWFGRLERSGISPGMVASVAAMFYDTDVRAVLPAIRVPTLVLHRHGDRLVNVRSGRYLAEHIPGAVFVEIPGTDHATYFERGDEIVDEIEEFVTGTRRAVEPDRRLATVLFSDIVGSTERASELGDVRWRDLLERHQELTRAELARGGGVEVKTTGDGFLATFDGPAAAIRCALAIRAATATIDVPIRIGLHCGEIEIMGDDIGGIAVHIASRVSALGDAGDVLVSRTVKDLVAGSGITFASRGTHTLKGVPDEWEILAVAA
jgi:pimeloyl-ACP methyl ester carboxylesterase